MAAIIETRALTKHYGNVVAVDHLDLTVSAGEVFGLLGPNGAGKTTTTLMLLGLTEPTSGTAVIDGHNCTRQAIAVKQMVGYLPDNVGFYPDMTGRENLLFTGRLNGLSDAECSARAQRLLERVGMTAAADQKTGTYSRGMRQRLGVADVLMKDPRVIIMDEPTLGIDPEGVRELMELIRRLSTEDGRTILISSHQLYQVQQICDRVGIFVRGRLVACGAVEELGRQLESEGRYVLELRAEALKPLKELLQVIPDVEEITESVEGLRIVSRRDVRREVTARVAAAGGTVLQLRQSGGDLDEIYRRYFEKEGEADDMDSHPSESGRSAFRLPWKKRKQQ